MLAALDRREVSSIELVDAHVERIDRHDGLFNAFAVRTVERARESAASADRVRVAGGSRGALLGLPMTLKESTQVAGLPQSAGIPELADHRLISDGPVASRVFAAGACLLGTTNISHALDDWDVVVCPASLDAAFPYDSGEQTSRTTRSRRRAAGTERARRDATRRCEFSTQRSMAARPLRRMTSRNQWALSRGVRSRVSKSTWTMPNRLS